LYVIIRIGIFLHRYIAKCFNAPRNSSSFILFFVINKYSTKLFFFIIFLPKRKIAFLNLHHYEKIRLSKTSFLLLLFTQSNIHAQNNYFLPGEIWYDTDGHPINAHGGGILDDKGTYYWFGEIKKGKTVRVTEDTAWENYRVDAGRVPCVPDGIQMPRFMRLQIQ